MPDGTTKTVTIQHEHPLTPQDIDAVRAEARTQDAPSP